MKNINDKQIATPAKIRRNVCPKRIPLNGPGPYTDTISDMMIRPIN